MRGKSSGGMPWPLSITEISTASLVPLNIEVFCGQNAVLINTWPPSWVYLIALSMRLVNTWAIRSASSDMLGSCINCWRNVMPHSLARRSNLAKHNRAISLIWVGLVSSGALPVSIRIESSKELTKRLRRSDSS